jgi:prephenate dehydrogenase
MMNNDVASAKRELLKTIDQWREQIKRIESLVRDSDSTIPSRS